jgi:hypothetical protein
VRKTRSPRFGKDEPRSFRRIFQRFAEPVHGFVQAEIEIHKSVGRPEPLDQLLSTDHLSGSLKLCLQNLEGLFLKNNVVSIDTKFAGVQVEFKLAKPDDVAEFRPDSLSASLCGGRNVPKV